MDLIVPNKVQELPIDAGDIVVMHGIAYLIREDHGTNTDFFLLGLNGHKENCIAYYSLEDLRKDVSKVDGVKLYKSDEYELRLFKKE